MERETEVSEGARPVEEDDAVSRARAAVERALVARGFAASRTLPSAWDPLDVSPEGVLTRPAARGRIAEVVLLRVSGEGRALGGDDLHALLDAARAISPVASRWDPVHRVTLVEIAARVGKPERARLRGVASPERGGGLASAIAIDVGRGRAWSNEGARADVDARADLEDLAAPLADAAGVALKRASGQEAPALFGPVAIGAAGALATPAAGALLFAWNLHMTRRSGAARAAVIATALALFVLAVLPLPPSIARGMAGPVCVSFGVAFYQAARQMFRPAPRRPPLAVSVGLVLGGVAIGAAAFMGAVLVATANEKTVSLPTGAEVTVRGGADEAMARRIGERLERAGLLGKRSQIVYARDGATHVLRLHLEAGAHKDPAVLSDLRILAGALSRETLSGEPVRMVLVDLYDEEMGRVDGD